MKTMFRISLLFAAVSALVVGCSKNEIEEPANPSRPKVQAELYANVPESRIEIGDIDGTQYPVTWSETGEEVAVIEFAGEADPTTVKSTEYELSGDKKLAHFTYSLDAVAEAATFDYFACYPYGVVRDNPGSKNYVSLDLSCLTSQKVATLGQVDTNCAVIVSSSTGHTEQQTSLDMYFNHVVSYAKMAIKGLEAGEVVESIVFSTESEAVLADTAYHFYYADGTNSATGTPSKSLAIDIPDSAADAEGKLENVWFVTLPVAEGLSNFTICVETADNTYTKSFSVSNSSKNLKFERGKVSKFTANMSGATKEAKTGEWSLLRNIATLHEGLEVIVVAADYDVALSTTQNTNNRGEEAVVKSANKCVIDEISSSVQVLTLKAGSVDNTYAFFTGEKYLYAANNTQNYLREADEIDDNASWLIEIADGGATTITAQGENNRNTLLYNQSSKLFSCYLADGGQKPVVLYYREPSVEPIINTVEADVTKFEAAGGEAVVTVSTQYVADATALNVSVGEADWISAPATVTVTDNQAVINLTIAANDVETPRNATLTVSLDGGNSKSIDLSQKAKATVSNSRVYRKITAEQSDWSGQYLIVYEGGNAAFDGSLTTLDATSNYQTISIVDDAITLTTDEDDFYFTIAKTASGYSIQSANGEYIGQTSNANGLTAQTTAINNTITYSSSVDIVAGGAYLRFNANTGQERFRYFKSDTYTNQKAVQLYQLEGSGAAPALDAPTVECTEKTDNTLTFTWAAVDGATGYKVSRDGSTWSDALAADVLTYTLTELMAGTEYTLHVKALGDGENSSDSLAATCTATTTGEKPNLEVSPTSLTWEADATDAQQITVTANGDWDHNVSDMDWATVSVSGDVITVTPKAANTVETANEGTITISMAGATPIEVTCSQAGKEPSGGDETTTVTDYIDRAFTGVAATTTYAAWSEKTGASGAVYAGNSAGGNDAVQLRTNNNNSGIVTTKSGGKVKKIVVTWNSNTSAGRTLDIYGKNSAYSAASDLYSTSTQGTKLGSIVKGTSTELTITGDYTYIGMRSNNAAMYITEIQITWETSGGGNSGGDTPATPTKLATPSVTATASGNTVTVSWGEISGAADYTVTCGDETPKTVTGTSTSFTDLAYSTDYEVSVVANPSDAATHTASDAGTASATTEADPNAGGGDVTPKTVTIKWSEVLSSGDKVASNTYTSNGVTIKFTKVNNSGSYYDGSVLRLYANDKMTITSASAIKQIVITTSSKNGPFTVDTGSISTSSTTHTWTGNATSVTFTASAQARFASIEITY